METTGNTPCELIMLIQGGIRLRDHKFIFTIGRKIFINIRNKGLDQDNIRVQFGNLLCHHLCDALTLLRNHFVRLRVLDILTQLTTHQIIFRLQGFDHPTIGGFNETILIHRGIGRHATDQTNVWSFRCFNRADPAVVGVVNVADIKASALSPQTTRT